MRKKRSTGKLLAIILPIFLAVFVFVGVELVGVASAAGKLTTRSLTLGDTRPGAITSYSYRWKYPTAATLGSIRLEACTDGYFLDPCTVPTGIDFSVANFVSQTGATGFSILSQTNNEILLTRPPSSSGAALSTYLFDNVTNPTGLPDVFYVRVRTYPTADGTGVENEVNSVVNATAEPIMINADVPPFLDFCVGITVSNLCGTVTGDFIDYGDLRDNVTRYGTSQFEVATNAVGGYVSPSTAIP